MQFRLRPLLRYLERLLCLAHVLLRMPNPHVLLLHLKSFGCWLLSASVLLRSCVLSVNSPCRKLLLGGFAVALPLPLLTNCGLLAGLPPLAFDTVLPTWGQSSSEAFTIWIVAGPAVLPLPWFGPLCVLCLSGPWSMALRLLLCIAGCLPGVGSWFSRSSGLTRWASVAWIFPVGFLLIYCLALLVALVMSSVPVGGGGRLSVGAVRRVTNWVLCLILSLSFLRSTARPLVNGLSVVLPLLLFAWGLLSRLLIFVKAIRLLLRASGRVALSPLLTFPMFSGIVRVGSILRSFLLVLSSPRSSLVLGGTVVRTRTWLLPFGLGCALSRIACGTPVSLGVLLTPFSKPVLVLSSCPFQRSVLVIRGWDTSKFVTL